MRTVFVIVGATASGKSGAAIELAKRISGEIVSADSMQIYRGMDIGTAKVTPEEADDIAHHMIDVCDPDFPYSVALYQEAAIKCIDGIISRGKTPILCGGTGLYINAITNDLDFSAPPDPELRSYLNGQYEERGAEHMFELLKMLDPEGAARIHKNNVKRVLRRLEIVMSGGGGEYDFSAQSSAYDFRIFGLEYPREELYRRIEARVDRMMERGLAGEVRTLDEQYGGELTSMQAIGYKEMVGYFRGAYSLDDAVSEIKKNTRHFAKRQLSWFRRDARISWLSSEKYPCTASLIDDIIKNRG